MREGDGWYGNYLVSRYPVCNGIVHNLETHADLEPRNAVDAVIDSPLGNIRVIGTHLSLSYLERFSEARNLLRLMREVEQETTIPLLLMGDINEWQPHSKLLRHLDAAMTALPCKATFPAFMPIFKLDRAWVDVPEGVKVTAHRMSGRGFRTLSDHLPLVLEISQP
jgi:endonuclease/exonuclease/phosphatase family metal-dependent hydrolase